MDPVKFLTTKDSFLRLAMQAVAREANELDIKLGERRATQIVNALSKSMKG